MQIHRQHAVGAGLGDQVGDQLGARSACAARICGPAARSRNTGSPRSCAAPRLRRSASSVISSSIRLSLAGIGRWTGPRTRPRRGRSPGSRRTLPCRRSGGRRRGSAAGSGGGDRLGQRPVAVAGDNLHAAAPSLAAGRVERRRNRGVLHRWPVHDRSMAAADCEPASGAMHSAGGTRLAAGWPGCASGPVWLRATHRLAPRRRPRSPPQRRRRPRRGRACRPECSLSCTTRPRSSLAAVRTIHWISTRCWLSGTGTICTSPCTMKSAPVSVSCTTGPSPLSFAFICWVSASLPSPGAPVTVATITLAARLNRLFGSAFCRAASIRVSRVVMPGAACAAALLQGGGCAGGPGVGRDRGAFRVALVFALGVEHGEHRHARSRRAARRGSPAASRSPFRAPAPRAPRCACSA